MARRYHETSSAYSLPNDNAEHVRLDQQSLAINVMIGRPFHADLNAIAKTASIFTALDLGCGTGIMTTRLARELQGMIASGKIKVYGVDLSPVPAVHQEPDNVEFIQGDIAEILGNDPRIRSGSIDYIFNRMLVLGITDWPAHFRRCFECLKPGGWVEVQDMPFRWYDSSGADISQHWQWWKLVRKAGLVRGVDILGPENIMRYMRETGFVDVHEEVFVWNWNREADDEMGRYTMAALQPGMPLYMRKMLSMAGMDENELSAEECLRTTGRMAGGEHTKFRVVWGRRP